MNCDEPRLLKACSAVRAPVPSIFAENDKRKKDLCQVPGAPNVNFRKISVRKTIWDLEFSEHLL